MPIRYTLKCLINVPVRLIISEFFSRRYELIWEGTFINFHLGPKVNKNICIFSYLNMFILINIYFVGHVYTLFGVGEEAYLRQVVKGVSLFRGVLLLGGVRLFIFDSLSRGYFY